MKRTRTLALLTALVCLCVSLTACSPKEVLKSAILKTTTALGLRQETSDEDEVDDLSYATGGGDVTFPETMDTTASKLVSEVDGDTLYVAFNGRTSTSYVIGSTVYYTTDGTCYQYNVSGVTPGRQYKVYISYDSTRYYITGGLKVQGLGSEELTTIENENTVQ